MRLYRFLTTSFIILALFLFGCGGSGVLRIAPEVPTFPYTPNYSAKYYGKGGVIFATWPKAKRSGVTFKVSAGNGSFPFVNIERDIRLGYENWNPALKGFVQYKSITGSDEPADVDIQIETNQYMHDRFGSDVFGWTIQEYANPSRTILKHVTTFIAGGTFADFRQRLATHEAGFGLGELGESPIKNTIMYSNINGIPLIDKITKEDANTFAYFYANAP